MADRDRRLNLITLWTAVVVGGLILAFWIDGMLHRHLWIPLQEADTCFDPDGDDSAPS